MTATIDKAGRIVLPKLLREKLNLVPGTEFAVTHSGRRVQLEPVAPKGELIWEQGIPVWVSEGPPVDFDVHAELMEDYDRRADFQSGRFGDDRTDLL